MIGMKLKFIGQQQIIKFISFSVSAAAAAAAAARQR
jgi:hypothetical protein